MSDQNTALVQRWFEEVWNQGRESTIDELLADDAVLHGIAGPGGEQIRGPMGFKPLYHQYRTAFPDIHFVIEDMLSDGDRIALRCRVTGTHAGAGFTPAPTGNRVEFTGMCIARLRDGRIAEAWNNFDFLPMYQQLGMTLS
jgi:steroid delta-isomerase-like uncharacterized protein